MEYDSVEWEYMFLCDPLEKEMATHSSILAWESCLENPMDRGDWQATVHGVSKESDMT